MESKFEIISRVKVLNDDLATVGQELTNSVTEYKAVIESYSVDDLHDAEALIIDELNKNDEYIKAREYELPKDGVFKIPEAEEEAIKLTKSKISDLILYFLNKFEVNYSMTLGLYQLYNFWKNSNTTEKVSYGMLDSTLRTLEQVKFKGYTEWRDILYINGYMQQMHDKYSRDLVYSIYLSQLHNAILDKLNPTPQEAGTAEDI